MSKASKELLRWLEQNTETDNGLDWLLQAPSDYLACRIRHPFPELLPGPLPPGVDYEPAPERLGCFQLTLLCPRCGMLKVKTTEPGGAFTAGNSKYIPPEGYASPPGSFITPTLCATELHRRFKEWEETHNVRR